MLDQEHYPRVMNKINEGQYMEREHVIDCFSAKYPVETMEKLNMSIDKLPDYEPLSVGGGSDTICLLFKKKSN